VRIDKSGTDNFPLGIDHFDSRKMVKDRFRSTDANDLAFRDSNGTVLVYAHVQHRRTALLLTAGRTAYEFSGVVNY
jgi:hypothetical protein